MKRRQGADTPFDGNIEIGKPIADVWPIAAEYSLLSPRKDKRYYKAGNLLLREHLGGDFSDPSDTRAVQVTIDTAGEHFTQLRKFGMCVVTFATEFSKAVDASEDPEDTAVAHSATSYITQAYPLSSRHALKNVPHSRIKEFISEPLSIYLAWCVQSGQDYVLSDVYNPRQYAWQASSGIIFLHDIDPLLLPIDADRITAQQECLANDFK